MSFLVEKLVKECHPLPGRVQFVGEHVALKASAASYAGVPRAARTAAMADTVNPTSRSRRIWTAAASWSRAYRRYPVHGSTTAGVSTPCSS